MHLRKLRRAMSTFFNGKAGAHRRAHLLRSGVPDPISASMNGAMNGAMNGSKNGALQGAVPESLLGDEIEAAAGCPGTPDGGDPARKTGRIRWPQISLPGSGSTLGSAPGAFPGSAGLPLETLGAWETLAPMAVLDSGLRLQAANRALLDLLEARGENAPGSCMSELVAPSHRRELMEGFEKLRSGQLTRIRKDFPLTHSGSDGHWIDAWISPLRDPAGSVQGYLLQATCIRPRKITENHLRQLNLQLRKNLEIRDAELRCTYEVLEKEIALRREAENRLLEAAEAERNRLGQELHDGLGQELAGVALLGKSIATQLAKEGHPTHRQVEKLSEYALQSVESARQIARGLFPVQLLRNGLSAALSELAQQCSNRFGIVCDVQLQAAVTGLPRETELHAYRIVQESLHNAVRHGQATRIRVETALHGPFFLLSISDNGSGFRSPGGTSEGMGLQLMAHRARITGGQFQIRESESGGVCVRCRWPRQVPAALSA